MISGQAQPYKPREVSRIDADIFRELILSNRLLAVFPKDPSKKIHFFEADSPSVIEKNFSFSLKVGQQKVDLTIELKPETPLVQRLNEVGGIESLPEEFRVALMAFASREIMDALEHLFQLPITVWDNAKEKEEASEKKALYFEVLDAHASCEARACITLSIPLLERLLAVVKEVPMIKGSSLAGELLQGEILVGGATLSLENWKSLQPGDLIMIQEPSALTTGQGKCLIKKSGIIPIMLEKDLFKSLVLGLEQIFPTGVKPLAPMLEQQGEQENSLPLSMPLELNFSTSLILLTIEEVFQLVKTKSLEKPLQISRPLKILIQEQVVGAGELVEINGRYALAVTQLYYQN